MMDVAQMVDVIQDRHGVTLDPTDPVFLLATMAAQLNKESREEFARMAAELSNQVSVALVLAENAARSRGEAIVTQAARWSSEHIKQAGADAATRICERLEGLTLQTQQAARRAKISAWFSVVAAAVALATVAFVLCRSASPY